MLVHHELVAGGRRLCRVENFCSVVAPWSHICFGVVQDLVAQLYREPAVLFKDKLNFKGPGGAGFLLHQDATAYATDKLASRHVSAMVVSNQSTRKHTKAHERLERPNFD